MFAPRNLSRLRSALFVFSLDFQGQPRFAPAPGYLLLTPSAFSG